MKRKKKLAAVITAYVIIAAMVGSSSETVNAASAQTSDEQESDSAADTVNIQSSYQYLPVGTYDSADTAILESVNAENGTVTLYNTVAARTYTLNYDGTTYVSDKYGTPMSMAQMTEGTIVNVNFFKATKQLVDIQVSPDAWSYENVTRYDLGGINSTATIGDRTYALTKGVQVFSQGKQTDLMNIVSGDSITVSGIGSDIYSIKVDTGHGYVRLSNDEALVGGWIEIGSEVITRVTESDMLLAVPEGSYTVHMYNDTSSVTQDITVDRNQEVILDCSGITAPVNVYGRILFHVTPETASLSLDGELQDISGIVQAEYGIHEIEVSASGYDTLTRYINVGNELSEITVNLDQSVAYVSDNSTSSSASDTTDTQTDTSSAKSTASSNSASSNTTSSNSTASSVTTSNRVYIYSPSDTEAYVDGVYVGLTPLSFKKVTGSHTVILKKSGYETRSYTIYCYNDGNDMSISFSDLVAVASTTTKKTSDSSSTTTKTDTGSTDTDDDTDDDTIDEDTDTDESDDDEDIDDTDSDETDDDAEDVTDDDSSDEDDEIDVLMRKLLTPDDRETGLGIMWDAGRHNTEKA